MGKPFDEIAKLQQDARAAFNAWEPVMFEFSHRFLDTLQEQLGWPESGFERLDFSKKDIPPNARLAPGGYSDKDGYHFALRISAWNLWLQIIFCASKTDSDIFLVKVENKTFEVKLGDAESFRAIVSDLTNDLKDMVLGAELTKQTGFRG